MKDMEKRTVRKILFDAFDSIKGGHIKTYYEQIKEQNDNLIPNKEQLKNVLKWSVKNTEYYKDFDYNDIHNFPILTKNIIREKKDEILAFDAKNKKLYKASTSGSTGVPLEVFWSDNKRIHQNAELIYYYEKADIKFGEKILHLDGRPKKRNGLKEHIKNIYKYDIGNFDDVKLNEIIDILCDKSSIACYNGYGSFNEELLNYMLRNNIHREFKLKSIITTSEITSLDCKKKLSKLTGAKVYDRYANSENGFLAQTDNCSDSFNVNVASFFIEVLKQDSDEEASKGEIGRIVITDLYNYAMPMIRYETGDLAEYSEKVDGWVTVLKTIHGRQSDIIYSTKGAKITTSSWNTYMDTFPLIKQYQLIQEEKKDYVLKVNLEKGIYNEENIIEALKKTLGSDANIVIEYVDGIPQLSSGKFKKTVCNYKP